MPHHDLCPYHWNLNPKDCHCGWLRDEHPLFKEFVWNLNMWWMTVMRDVKALGPLRKPPETPKELA